MLPILLLHPRLMWRLFIAVFYTIARASSISFHLHQQFFVDTKIFALEWLFMTQYISYCLPVFLFFSNKIFVFLCMLSFQKQEYISFFFLFFFSLCLLSYLHKIFFIVFYFMYTLHRYFVFEMQYLFSCPQWRI